MLFRKPDAIMRDRVYTGHFCAIGWAHIDNEVMIADGVRIIMGRHQHGDAAPANSTMHENPKQYTKVAIGSGAWIGAGAIVGAGAVVVEISHDVHSRASPQPRLDGESGT